MYITVCCSCIYSFLENDTFCVHYVFSVFCASASGFTSKNPLPLREKKKTGGTREGGLQKERAGSGGGSARLVRVVCADVVT